MPSEPSPSDTSICELIRAVGHVADVDVERVRRLAQVARHAVERCRDPSPPRRARAALRPPAPDAAAA